MNCREAVELLAEHGAGEPAPTAGWRFKLHLWCCRHCRNYRATYDTTIRLEKIAFQEPDDDSAKVPEDLVTQIMSAVRGASAG